MSENKDVAIEEKERKELDFMKSLDSMVHENETLKVMCKKLMTTPHYARMKEEGIFAVLVAAKSHGIDPFKALNGGFHYIQGRTQMSAELMSNLIRSKGHSIIKDVRSDNAVCILKGKRSDTGDEITVRYSMQEAEKAGYLKKDNWINHPQAMLFAAALRLLARQLFSDVIYGVLGEGEDDPIEYASQAPIVEVQPGLDEDQIKQLKELAEKHPDSLALKQAKDLSKTTEIEKIHAGMFNRLKLAMIKEASEKMQTAMNGE